MKNSPDVVNAGRTCGVSDEDLNELAYSAHAEAMSFGLSHETFLRYFKTIRDRVAAASEKDAVRYRKLRGWMSSNVPEGWQQVEDMGALCAWVDWAAMDAHLDSLPECSVGLMSKPATAA